MTGTSAMTDPGPEPVDGGPVGTELAVLELSPAEIEMWLPMIEAEFGGPVYVFPGKPIANGKGGWTKKPWPGVRWSHDATADPAGARALWERCCGEEGRAVVCVACGPTGIWVLDEDRDLSTDPDADRGLIELLAGVDTLVLTSSGRSRPHYVFRQPEERSMWVGEGRWDGGEVKASGMIYLSRLPALRGSWASVREAPPGLVARLEVGRERGVGGHGVATEEQLWDWIVGTPFEGSCLSDGAQAKFLDQITDRLWRRVMSEGEHRRQACLAAVYTAALEAAAGCYSAERAYEEILGAYEVLRARDGSWTPERLADYNTMWATIVPQMRAGDLDARVLEVSERLREAGYGDDIAQMSDSDVTDLFSGLLAGPHEEPSEPEEPAATPVSTNGAHPEPSGTALPGNLPEDATDALHENAPGVESHPAVDTVIPVAVPVVPATPPGIDPGTGEVIDLTRAVGTAGAAVVEPGEAESLSWPAVAAAGSGKGSGPATPVLDEAAALWGPHGELVNGLHGMHEASKIGVLGGLLAWSGAMFVGAGHLRIGVSVHGPNVFVLNIGDSSIARKSTALSIARHVFYELDDPSLWPGGAIPLLGARSHIPRRLHGQASGEVLIHEWDPEVGEDVTTGAKVERWPERRVVLEEGEASTIWKRSRRDGSVLGDTFCKMWDGDELSTKAVTSGKAIVPGDRYAVGLIGASTRAVAQASVASSGGLDALSGFGNRFLWLWLPDSGIDLAFDHGLDPRVIARYRARLGILDTGKGLTDRGWGRSGISGDWGPVMGWSAAARKMWDDDGLYRTIKRDKGSGLIEGMLSRAETQVLRLALNYTLVAGEPEICVPALEAAVAVWRYARASVEFLFADVAVDPRVDTLREHLLAEGGWALLKDLKSAGFGGNGAKLVADGARSGVFVSGVMGYGPSYRGKVGRRPNAVALRSLFEGWGGSVGESGGVPLPGMPDHRIFVAQG